MGAQYLPPALMLRLRVAVTLVIVLRTSLFFQNVFCGSADCTDHNCAHASIVVEEEFGEYENRYLTSKPQPTKQRTSKSATLGKQPTQSFEDVLSSVGNRIDGLVGSPDTETAVSKKSSTTTQRQQHDPDRLTDRDCLNQWNYNTSKNLVNQSGHLAWCHEHEKLTCCDRKDTEALRQQVASSVAGSDSLSAGCRDYMVSSSCAKCDAAVGVGVAVYREPSEKHVSPVACSSYCSNWYQACEHDYFLIRHADGRVGPCGSNAAVCARLSSIFDGGGALCENFGMAVAVQHNKATTEETLAAKYCFDGKPSLSSSGSRPSPRKTSTATITVKPKASKIAKTLTRKERLVLRLRRIWTWMRRPDTVFTLLKTVVLCIGVGCLLTRLEVGKTCLCWGEWIANFTKKILKQLTSHSGRGGTPRREN